jgi:hypothetical protein
MLFAATGSEFGVEASYVVEDYFEEVRRRRRRQQQQQQQQQ